MKEYKISEQWLGSRISDCFISSAQDSYELAREILEDKTPIPIDKNRITIAEGKVYDEGEGNDWYVGDIASHDIGYAIREYNGKYIKLKLEVSDE